jgi:hypothetical protein
VPAERWSGWTYPSSDPLQDASTGGLIDASKILPSEYRQWLQPLHRRYRLVGVAAEQLSDVPTWLKAHGGEGETANADLPRPVIGAVGPNRRSSALRGGNGAARLNDHETS